VAYRKDPSRATFYDQMNAACNGRLRSTLKAQRKAGHSFAWIASYLSARTHIFVSRGTVDNWCKELDIK
jgi:hypothetical protein